MSRKAIIIGAGPAGLTAAYELLKRTDIKPIILEKSGDIGGISKTINYKGNRMDIGGHRFFSKSDRVMNWWLNIMPLEKTNDETVTINYQNKTHSIYTSSNQGTGGPVNPGLVMLVRKRLSRIYFLRKFFDYPIQLSIDTLRKLGFIRTIRILFSYLVAKLIPRKPEITLEDFFINRFGKQLYLLFFKDYTEKVWGVPCNEISAEWGAQRIKGVSISKAIRHAAQTMFKKKNVDGDISQKNTETSLIEQFLYPALGPGQLWEEVARQIEILGGTILMHQDVTEIKIAGNKVKGVVTVNSETGEISEHTGDYFFSTMPVQELIAGIDGSVPNDVKEVAAGLQYRDFITVGVLLQRPSADEMKSGTFKPFDLKDTWIYIQEKDVKVGRLQLFNNWSPYMVNKPDTFWIGMEYFCNKGDAFWSLTDEKIQRTAIEELEKMGLAGVETVLDSTVHRIEKTYPAYFGTYNQFDKIRAYIDRFQNLFLVGRNGMHKYNNADHSMLTAMTAVDNICQGVISKENIWAINTEQEYHEKKAPRSAEKAPVMELQPTPTAEPQTSFSYFVFHQQRKFLWMAIALCSLQFIVFKILYPYANYMPDSFAYIDGAARNLDINFWPIGYSKFLRLLNIFSHSDWTLVIFQYCVLQFALLYFLFTILYFLTPGAFVKWGLMIFFCINPAFLSISNFVLTDCIFTGLTIIWFTQLLWIIFRPNKRIIILHSLLLFVLFAIRYNALYYPIISGFVVLRSTISWQVKFISQGIAILLIGLFVWQTSSYYKTLTGSRQFSAFGGWMLANNALMMYRNLPMNGRSDIPKGLERLHQITAHHLDSIRYLIVRPDSTIQIYYMWSATSPLNQFLAERYKNDNTTPYFKRWASVGPLYGQYGKYLIEKYPFQYAKYFMWQNTLWYFAPVTENIATYNMEYDTVPQLVVNWFNYKSTKVKFANKEITPVKLYTMLLSGINIVFFMLLFWSIFSRTEVPLSPKLSKALKLVVTVWFFNIAFSIIAAPIVLRYQLFTMALLISFGGILIEVLLKAEKALQNKKIVSNENPDLAFVK
jgi:protoporphyrinogen oxidase